MNTSFDDVIYGGEWYDDFNSGNISRFKYEHDRQLLTVEFDGGNVYEYDGVPEDVVLAWCFAPSKSTYHTKKIKWAYQFRKL